MKDGNVTLLDEKLTLERDYWLQKLSEAAAPASFPLDFPRPGAAAGKGRLKIEMDPAISRRLVQVCGGRNTLVLAALLTATKILLHRYTGLRDVIVGTTVHRQHGEVIALNRLLAVRDPVDPETTGRKLLLAVKDSLAEAYEHQKLPFQRLVELLGIERQRDQPALFSVLVLLENINLRVHADEAVTDVVLTFRRSGEEVAGTLEFEEGLFCRRTAEILARHLLAILRGMLAEPDLPVAALRLLAPEDEERLIRRLSPPASFFPDRAVHRLFEEQAARTPDRDALVLGGSSLTYRGLNEQANRLAAFLARSGVRSGDRVALCLEHSFDLVVSVLAVLKAGAAYVPLDPDYPKARLDYVIADSGARLVLVQEALAGRVEGHRSVLLLERHRGAVEQESPSDPPVEPEEAGRLAYVIYTSGSTGAPKGVQIRHASLVNYVWWAREVYLRGESLDFALYTSLSFDLTVTSLYTPLITGNRLVLYPRLESEYPLLDLVRDDRVEVVKLTPSHLELIKDRDNGRSRIRRLIVGGEALPTATARQVLDSFGGRVEICNEYGPTEATVGCMLHRYDPAADRRGFVPIGLPAANVRLYVLDEALRPVAENMIGELFIAGDGLAEGYLNQQGLTAERFVADPFAPGRRMYRSGDLVRLLPEGILDFVGRSDEQVKIRGYRIELSEIRGALNAHPGVRESVVAVVRESTSPVLVAYYVARKEVDEGELRAFLAGSLLEEAIPAFFVHLRRLPLTLNGKVNLKALPSLAEIRKRARPGYVAPRTDAERVMAGIWASVLGLAQVGVHDNFFHLGGDSIVGIRVVAKANQAGFRLVPRQLFQHQTVAELAAVTAEAPAPAQEEGPEGPVPLTPIQRAFFEGVEIDPWHYNQAVALELQGPAARRPELLREALARLFDRHDALRLRYERQADGWRQVGQAAGEPPSLVRIDLSGLGAEPRRAGLAAAAAALQASLELEQGPLARFAVFHLGSGEAERLLAVIHHLAVDGVSWRILLEELEESLRALAAGEPVRLPPRTSSFRTWATRIAELARAGAFDAELPEWLSLESVSAPLLPVDFPGGVNDVSSVREVSVSLSEEETRALLQDVPRAYRTQIDDVLLTALVESLASWTGRRRLLVALEGHGREEIAPGLDLSRTVGWFTSVFPVLLDVEGVRGPGEALKAVKERLRAIPNRGVGFGLLRHLGEGEGAERLRRLPEPELAFNYLGRFDDVLAGASSLRPAQGESGPARSPRQRRPYLLEIDGLIAGGRLGLRWTFSGNLHRTETIDRLAAGFAEQLRALIAHCAAPGAGGWTPSDFPLARIGQELLDRLASARELEDLYPLSPLQQGLLFHSLDRRGADTYFRQLSCTLRGPLDTSAFLRASQMVVDRHPVLRTAFLWEGAPEPLQVVAARAALPVEERDWRSLGRQEREERCRAFRDADRERGFDLAEPPLLRLALLRLEDEVHQLVWSFHHLVSDGWSFPLAVAETFGIYEALRRGEEPRMETPRPFRDYIAWLLRQDLAAAERFWRGELAEFTVPTPLALDREPRGADSGPLQSEERSFLLPARITGALQEWSRRHRLTLNTMVQGAWALLLARCAGERDVVFGAVSSGRSAALAGIESMLGVFINTLPVRVRLREREPLLAWLRGIQERQAEAREYEYSPLAQVQAWSEVPRGQGLFQSLMAFENYPVEAAVGQQGSSGLQVTGLEFPESTNYPLTLMMAPGPRLPIRLIYDRRRLDASTIVRWTRHFEALLEAFADQPRTAVEDLPMVAAAERHQLLSEWNDTRRSPLRAELIHQLFERQAELRPEAAAVIFDGGCRSYAELNGRSNRLAHLLRSLGTGAGDLVAVYLSRSPEMVEAVLGILKAGAAYVPLDADYPRARIEWILAAQGIRCLVTETGRLEALAGLDLPELGHVICVDGGRADLAAQPATDPPPAAGPDDTAYVIFTSGSTGAPKGVVLRHAPVVNLIDWVNRTFAVGERDRVLFITSLCFDLSVYDIFGLLAAGGSIRIAAKEQVRDPEELLRLLREEPITFWDSAPAALQQLAPYLSPPADGGSGGRLRLVFLSGDWIPVALPDQLREAFPEARVVGLGGATEAAIWSNFFPVDGSVADRVSVPYGRPIQNARYHVLDEKLEPCPIGVAGDLYIAGDCLASGYAGAPELTAERFVADPFAAGAGARFYWTGDRARYLPDGNLEFLGRRDHQVKVRGFRIELGEIEAALAQHPGIVDAVAMVREDQPSHRRLAAYFVPREEPGPDRAELRAYLSERLPDYMVPAAFVAISRLPLTSNGKLDRRALPAPEDAAVPDAGAGVAPRNDVEERLVRVWSEVLGVERVGVTDNFFELGGDSILSIQVVSRAGQAGIRIATNQLFEHPTIAELAAVAAPGVVAPAPQGRETGEVPLTPAQRWFFEAEPAEPQHFNQALLLRVNGGLDPGVLERALARLAEHHDALRLRFRRTENGWLQDHAEGDPRVPLLVLDLSNVPPGETAAAVERAAARVQASLDLAGPLFRAAVFRLGSGRPDRLLLVAHHLLVDGVSWRILLEDLAEIYLALSSGAAPEPRPRTTSFRRWAELLERHARSSEVAEELGYWTAPERREAARLPVDFERGPDTVGSAKAVTVTLDRDETRALLEEAPGAFRAQVVELLLSAVAAALARWTGSPLQLVEIEGHGREPLAEEADLSRTVGWFTTFSPLLLDLRGAEGPAEALRQVKEQVRAVPRRGLGHGLLRYLAGPEAGALRTMPRPEVSFNYLGRLDQVLAEGSLFSLAPEPAGAAEAPVQERRYRLMINAAVLRGELGATWVYSGNLHRRETVEALAADFAATLRALLRSRDERARALAPSDFPLARLDAAALDRLLAVPGLRIEDVYPLAPLQEGLLFHALEGTSGQDLYFEQLTCRLVGELRVDAFRHAWQSVTARHPILRTAFVLEDIPEPLQVVDESAAPEWSLGDWSALAETERPLRLRGFLESDRAAGFDLSRAPLMRFALFRLGPADHRFVWSFHHLLLDGWSLALVLQDLLALYQEEDRPAPRPYRDYVAWVRQQDLGAAEAFWRGALKGFTAPTPLPSDRRPAATPGRGRRDAGETSVRLSLAASERLGQLAKRHQVTPNTLVTGAWALLLARWSAEPEVLFGVVSSGRPPSLPDAERMVGLFINTLPLRVAVPPRERMPEWLRRLQATQLEARQYEHSPLSSVTAWSEIGPGQPLFESLVIYENFPASRGVEQGQGSGLEVREVDFREASNYPITLLAVPDASIRLTVLYDGQRFDPSTACRLLQQLEVLLEGMAGSPTADLASLPLLTSAARHQILCEWAQGAEGSAGDFDLHQLFARQAVRTPQAVALIWRDQRITYADLERRIGRLALRLRRESVGPEVAVGIHLGRTPGLVVALLAVFEAGGFYVPLDPTLPAERLGFLLRDSGARVLLNGEGLAAPPDADGVRTLVLSDAGEVEEAVELPALAVPEGGSGGHLAYLIYTSGSTGRPKGVAIEQRSAMTLVHWAQRVFPSEDLACVLASTSISFDLSVFEIFVTLAGGGTVVLVDHALMPPPPDAGVRLINTVPSALGELLDSGALPPTVTTVNLAGEALPLPLAERILRHPGVERLYNLYGPTEDTTYSTWARIAGGDGAPPIGRPIDGTRALVLDGDMRPLPPGVAGELHLGGYGLARGYFGRPDLTAGSFVPDPFTSHPGARLYRTGDLVRWRGDGRLEYLGRRDHQVKLRGFRIECGEIEATLSSHPGVARAAVLAVSAQGESRLVAFLVPRPGSEPSSAELRSLLLGKLPAYMVPASFVTLPELPLNANGKVDRRALAATTSLTGPKANPYVAPESELERVLADLWREELHVDRVGRYDNFFELGGHSLVMLRLFGKIKQRFASSLLMVELFEYPTVSAMAQRLAMERSAPRMVLDELGQGRAEARLQARRRRAPRPEAPEVD